jgi:hypothetical protein
MEYSTATESAEVLLQYPDVRDINFFKTDAELDAFLNDVKRFAFPYVKTLQKTGSGGTATNRHSATQNASLVQFYTFVFTDERRKRRYGFCRSARGGSHILCMVSYLPWYNVLMSILNKISTIINEKEVTFI